VIPRCSPPDLVRLWRGRVFRCGGAGHGPRCGRFLRLVQVRSATTTRGAWGTRQGRAGARRGAGRADARGIRLPLRASLFGELQPVFEDEWPA
jgi:hypothetical protein